MKKEAQKQSFKTLAKKVTTLSATQKGQLKGGFSSVTLIPKEGAGANGSWCIC